MKLKKRPLFDLSAPNASTGIINGESSNILNWNDVRYPWTYSKYKRMLANHWTPFEVKNMAVDKKQFWQELNEKEREAFLLIIGSLTSLDSVQSDMVMKFADYVTDSAVNACLIMIAKEEVIHNQSYSYILHSIVDESLQQQTFDLFKNNELLQLRNRHVFELYQMFDDERTAENFLKAIVADIGLEGIFFYSGFAFFYDLARHGKMIASSTMINWINR